MKNNLIPVLLLLFTIYSPSVIFSQSHSLSDTLNAGEYFQKGDSLLKSAKFDTAYISFENARGIYEELNRIYPSDNLTEKILECGSKLGWVLMKQGKYDRALSLLEEDLSYGKKNLGESNIVIAQNYNITGVVYWAKTDYKNALEYYNKSLSIITGISGPVSRQVSAAYNNIGIIYEEMGSYDKALDYYQRALDTDLKLNETDEEVLARTYNNIGVVYNGKGDYDKALEYHEKALSIRLRILGEENPYTATSLTNTGIVHANKNDYRKALEYFNKALIIDLNKFGEVHPSVGKGYNNLANCYFYLNSYDSALEYSQKSFKIKSEILGDSSSALLTDFIVIGKIYMGKGDYDSAVHALEKGIALGTYLFGLNNEHVASGYIRLAEVYDLKNERSRALYYCQQALIALVPSFRDTSLSSNPGNNVTLSEVELLNALNLKADIIGRGDDISSLQMAVDIYKAASELTDRMRTGYKSENSKLHLGVTAAHIFEKGADISLKLFTITNNEKYKHLSFMFAEKSKAAVLQDGLIEIEAKEYARIPRQLLDEEKQLKSELAFYETQLRKESIKKDNRDSTRIGMYNDELFRLRSGYDALLLSFSKDYPEYYNLKYRAKAVTVPEIQKNLPMNTTLLQYFIGESKIHVFAVTKEKFEIFTSERPQDFQKILSDFYTSILKTESKKYVSSSNKLSALLIHDVIPFIEKNGRNVVIIPHDILHKLPFEALFSSRQFVENIDYTKLDYLVRRFSISYHYSAELYLNTFSDSSYYQKEQKFIGFAPVFPADDILGHTNTTGKYASLSGGQEDVLRSFTADGKKLNELKYSEWEVRSILKSSGKISGSAYLYKDATEENFKKEIKNSNIIHIATHSFINEELPQLSGIIFAQTESNNNHFDGVLYAGEIYNLEMNADLVVLSSCESGIGRLIKGEGMMAFTRGFIYAGASNIIFSLWKISDKHTSELFVNFYKSAFGNEKRSYAAALREAKIKLINDPSTARPRSWAGILMIGRGQEE